MFEEDGDADDPPSGKRWLLVLAVALVGSLVAGVAVLGLQASKPPPAIAKAQGCRAHALKYTVTDDAKEYARQKEFEQNNNVVPDPAFYTHQLDQVPALHAAAHQYVVVFFRFGLSSSAAYRLVALEKRAVDTGAKVLVSPRTQGDAFVVIAGGYELVCSQDSIASADTVSRFAAEFYPSVADPNLPKTTSARPSATTPSGAPSPTSP